MLNQQSTDHKAADRQRADGGCTECRDAQSKRQQAGSDWSAISRAIDDLHLIESR
jgi:hypothetical protein